MGGYGIRLVARRFADPWLLKCLKEDFMESLKGKRPVIQKEPVEEEALELQRPPISPASVEEEDPPKKKQRIVEEENQSGNTALQGLGSLPVGSPVLEPSSTARQLLEEGDATQEQSFLQEQRMNKEGPFPCENEAVAAISSQPETDHRTPVFGQNLPQQEEPNHSRSTGEQCHRIGSA